MNKTIQIRTGRHVVFSLHAHLVFVTKYRKNVFNKQLLDYLKIVFNNICNSFEVQLIEFEGESDHIHLLINYPPKLSLSKLVNSLKGVSSRLLRTNTHLLSLIIGNCNLIMILRCAPNTMIILLS